MHVFPKMAKTRLSPPSRFLALFAGPAAKQAVVLTLLSLAATMLAYQFRFPIRIDLSHGDELALRGFYQPEKEGPDTYRWTTGNGQVLFPAPGKAAPLLLTIRARAWRHEDQVYAATVTVNDRPVGSIDKAGWRTWSFLISDPSFLRPGELVVGITSTPFVQSDLYPSSTDSRPLGVAVDWVEIEPQWSAGTWWDLLTIPSRARLLFSTLTVLVLYLLAWTLAASARVGLLMGLAAILINAVQIAILRTATLQALLLCFLLLGLITTIDRGLVSRWVRFVKTGFRLNLGPASSESIAPAPLSEPTAPANNKTSFVVVGMFLLWYIALGVRTELVLITGGGRSPTLMEDLNIYARAYAEAVQGSDPYIPRDIGVAYLYPPPALLVLAPFASISPPLLRAFLYIGFNVLLLSLMLWQVSRRYGYSLRSVWWWFPLVFGFAPFLELLHVGQINLITGFGILLVFLFESTLPALAGAGLALAAITKVTPLAFFAYLAVARSRRAIAYAVLLIAGALVVSLALFGWGILNTYVDVFGGLTRTFLEGNNSQALVSILHALGRVGKESWQQVQSGLEVYLAVIFAVSAILAYRSRQREPFFLVLSLGTMVSPNIMYYHHYVFILLPVFIWIAWRRFNPVVVAWCLTGLILIQVDRWYWTSGLLPHLFVHASILWILADQVRHLLASSLRPEAVFPRPSA